jgi:hypothetical protein
VQCVQSRSSGRGSRSKRRTAMASARRGSGFHSGKLRRNAVRPNSEPLSHSLSHLLLKEIVEGKRTVQDLKRKERFVVVDGTGSFSGSGPNLALRSLLWEGDNSIYNCPENADGSLIRCLIFLPKTAESVTLRNTLVMHYPTQEYVMQQFMQSMGRIARRSTYKEAMPNLFGFNANVHSLLGAAKLEAQPFKTTFEKTSVVFRPAAERLLALTQTTQALALVRKSDVCLSTLQTRTIRQTNRKTTEPKPMAKVAAKTLLIRTLLMTARMR